MSMEYLSDTGTLKSQTRILAAMVAIFGPTPLYSRNLRTIDALGGSSAHIGEALPKLAGNGPGHACGILPVHDARDDEGMRMDL
jgi:hypothetical protein